jgi:protein SCO1/2
VEAAIGPSFIRKSNFIEKMVLSKLFWVLACSFLFAYPISKSINRVLPVDLPFYGDVPVFRFTDENGKSFGTNELKGKVYIANFMFTSCQTSCPILLKKVQTVQHRIRGVIDRAAIVSFTVDPDTDTSKVLFDKARELKANPVVWRFLTASLEDTKALLVDGFKVPVGDKTVANSVMDVAHSNKLVLVDQEGKIRGYYSIEKNGIDQLMIDTGLLINKKKKS